MKLKICSASDAKEATNWNPQHWNVISIGSLRDDWPRLKNARDFVKINFDDLEDHQILPGSNKLPPQPDEIEKALKFARKYPDGPLLIHCFAGVSRSTAIAFLILFDKFREVNFALDFLYDNRSCARPNNRIIRLGLKLLVKNKEERLRIWDIIHKHPKWIRAHSKEQIIV